jgi:ABC-type uncharacterized transport system substrate-binding protein
MPRGYMTGSGGLISYGADQAQQWQAAASYVDRIPRGEKPREDREGDRP